MAIDLFEIPPELVIQILEYLPARDIGRCGQTCSRFKDLCSTVLIWQRLCQKVIGNINSDKWEASYYEIYTRVLHKYGRLLGLWRRQMGSYGGLLQVKVEDDRLVGTEIKAPFINNIHGPVRRKKILSIGLNKCTRKTEILCHGGHGEPHPGIIMFDKDQTDVIFRCEQLSSHSNPEGDARDFESDINEETNTNTLPFTVYDQRRLAEYRSNIGEYKLFKIEIQPPDPVYPIQPGIFIAHYSVHGIEMFLLSYNLDKMEAHILKITGDPNVPSGEISIFINLRKPLRLTKEDQLHPENFDSEWEDSVPESDKIEPYDQDFIIPQHFQAFFGSDYNPTRCKYRFISKGRIAGSGFTDPSFSKVHMIMLEEDDTILAMWVDTAFEDIDAFYRINGLTY